MFKIHKFRHISNKKYQHVCARNSLKELIIKSFLQKATSKKAVQISKDSLGKPSVMLYNKKGRLEVSISHTKKFTFVGYTSSSCCLGVDVEEIHFFSQVLLDGFLTQQEKEVLKNAPQKDFFTLATKIWCIKESIMKALGYGLRLRPLRIEVVNFLFKEEGAVVSFSVDGKKYNGTLVFLTHKNDHIFTGIEIPKKIKILICNAVDSIQ